MTDHVETRIQFGESKPEHARIKVIGVGGAGGNAVNAMVNNDVHGVEFIVVNTDVQDIENSLASRRIQIGKNVTRGLGAGSNPEIGRKAIEEDKDEVMSILSETDMVFITAGMGGGTGTGAAPVIATMAKSMGALTVAVVTKPFFYENKKRQQNADGGIEELRNAVDTLIIIPNDRILEVSDQNILAIDGFKIVDNVLLEAIRSISDLITKPGYMNQDFADLRTVMMEAGDAMIGSATGRGNNRATIAAQKALSSPLMDGISIRGASGVILNIAGSSKSVTMQELQEAAVLIQEHAGEDANVIFGVTFDESLGDEIRIIVVATGFNADAHRLKDLNRRKTVDVEQISPQPIAPQSPVNSQVAPVKAIRETMLTDKADAPPPVAPNQIPITLSGDSELPPFIKQIPDIEEASEKADTTTDEDASKKRPSPGRTHQDYDIPTFLRKSMD